ncbi:hypothetical protein KCT17_003672 [Escherichia coli]|nr:hypothetical protein [Escherichia coli]
MTKSWFTHEGATYHEAVELVARYQKRGNRAEMLLAADQRTYIVNVWLPEAKHLPRSNVQPNKCWM